MGDVDMSFNLDVGKKALNSLLLIVSALLGVFSVNGALYLANNSGSLATEKLASAEKSPTYPVTQIPVQSDQSSYGFPCTFIAVLEQDAPKLCSKNGSSDLSGKNNVPDAFYNDGKEWFSFNDQLSVSEQQCKLALKGPAIKFNPGSIRHIVFGEQGKYAVSKWVCIRRLNSK